MMLIKLPHLGLIYTMATDPIASHLLQRQHPYDHLMSVFHVLPNSYVHSSNMNLPNKQNVVDLFVNTFIYIFFFSSFFAAIISWKVCIEVVVWSFVLSVTSLNLFTTERPPFRITRRRQQQQQK